MIPTNTENHHLPTRKTFSCNLLITSTDICLYIVFLYNILYRFYSKNDSRKIIFLWGKDISDIFITLPTNSENLYSGKLPANKNTLNFRHLQTYWNYSANKKVLKVYRKRRFSEYVGVTCMRVNTSALRRFSEFVGECLCAMLIESFPKR